MAKQQTLSYDVLLRSLRNRDFAPFYLLHGEEGFYIDRLLEYFEENALDEDEREFNLSVVYGTDTPASAVVALCNGYPVMAERRFVVVKEAQGWKVNDFNVIAKYLEHLVPTTTLVVASRGKKIEYKNFTGAISASRGVDFESKRLKEAGVAGVVEGLLKSNSLNIEQKGLEMLCSYVGTDLSRLYGEVGKLSVALPAGAMVTPEVIERLVGVSREYNVFELKDAILNRNASKAISIVEYFRASPSVNPAIPVLATIFAAFSDITVYHFLKDKSPSSVKGALGLRWDSQVAAIERGARNYNARKSIEIITAIRDADRKMKGVGSRQNAYDLLRDLLFVIFNARGI